MCSEQGSNHSISQSADRWRQAAGHAFLHPASAVKKMLTVIWSWFMEYLSGSRFFPHLVSDVLKYRSSEKYFDRFFTFSWFTCVVGRVRWYGHDFQYAEENSWSMMRRPISFTEKRNWYSTITVGSTCWMMWKNSDPWTLSLFQMYPQVIRRSMTVGSLWRVRHFVSQKGACYTLHQTKGRNNL